jgi:hypothetical protein
VGRTTTVRTTPQRTLALVSLPVSERPLSALPSVTARVVAFVAIILAGAAGGVIGWTFVALQTTGDHSVAKAIGAAVCAVLAALGMAVVSVLVMRAMGEWRMAPAVEE